MKALKAVVENGKVTLAEPMKNKGCFNAIVVLMEADPWAALLHDPRPRPQLVKAREKAVADFAVGKTQPIGPELKS